jgi:alkylation response protein AidB-like acyl-CoA dehydrogenase
LGVAGKGHVIAFNILNIGRYKLGVGAVGGSKRALEITAAYTNQRQQFKTKISDFNLTKEKLATMASKIYAAESSVYRTGPMIRQSKLTDEQVKMENQWQLQSEYAIECSVNKFFASEVLDYVVDEGVQIHGGYGFMQEYTIERAYRDSRINRIFEGTNEINRLLVPGTFLKKALKGELPLLQKAQGLQEELMMMIPEEPGDEPLAQEKMLVRNAKKIGILAAGLAAQKYGNKLDQEQEILSNIADIASLAYAAESVVLRTEKAIAATGLKNKQKVLYTEIFVQEAFNEIEQHAKALIAVETGVFASYYLPSQADKTQSINVIAKNVKLPLR